MSRSNYYCCVPQCKSWIKRNPDLSFHTFPKVKSEWVIIKTGFGTEKIDRRALWMKQLRMGKNPSPYMRVCNLHFTSGYFCKGGESMKVRRLKKGTYPTQNLPQIKMDVPKKTSSPYEARLKSRLAMIESQEMVLSVNSEDECENAEAEFIESREDEIIAVDALLQLATTTPLKTFRDFQVQVDTPKIVTLTDNKPVIKYCPVLLVFKHFQY